MLHLKRVFCVAFLCTLVFGVFENKTAEACESKSGWIPQLPWDINLSGWVQSGYHSETTGMFNNQPDRLNTHQAWACLEKSADGKKGFDFGFRVDLMYGIDSADTQAFGNNPGRWDFINGWDRGATYGWALPQLYAEIAAGDLSIKAGHFYTLAGYEVVTAPDNFFYSHALGMYNSEPFTHTGVLATYQGFENLTLYGGWTAGWDTGFDRFNDGSNFLGGFSWQINDMVTVTYITTVGEMGFRGEGYTHHIVLDAKVTDRINYVLQHDHVNLEQTFFGFGSFTNVETGIINNLFYTVSDRIKLGARFEWWKSNAGFNHGGMSLPLGGHNSYYNFTFGANINVLNNVVIRPEIRHDWFPASAGFGAQQPGYDQTIFGIDTIMTF